VATGAACPQRLVEFVDVDGPLAFGAAFVGLCDWSPAALEADRPRAVRAANQGAAVDAGGVVSAVGRFAPAGAVAVGRGDCSQAAGTARRRTVAACW
jgi:hypothetical protein